MTRMIRYAGSRAIVRAASSHPSFKYANYAYKYGPTAMRAGARIGSWAYKRYKRRRGGTKKRAKFSSRNIGERIGSDSCKQVIERNDGSFSARSTRVLYSRVLTSISKGDNINDREKNKINCRGFKICLAFYNTVNSVLYVNIAVLSKKNEETNPDPQDFFRSDGARRSVDFDNTLSGLETNCLAINTDKYVILKRKRMLLNNDSNGGVFTRQSGSNFRTINWYIKLKRQLRFTDNTTDIPLTGNVFLVYWFDRFIANAADTPVGNAVQMQERHVMYYREPKA